MRAKTPARDLTSAMERSFTPNAVSVPLRQYCARSNRNKPDAEDHTRGRKETRP